MDELVEQLGELCARDLQGVGRFVDLISTHGEPVVLLCLHHEGRPMLSGELAERSGLTTGRMANILKGLEQRGLVTRVPHESDGRRVVVALTQTGAAQAQAEYERMRTLRREFLSYLGPDDAPEFVRLFERCVRYQEG